MFCIFSNTKNQFKYSNVSRFLKSVKGVRAVRFEKVGLSRIICVLASTVKNSEADSDTYMFAEEVNLVLKKGLTLTEYINCKKINIISKKHFRKLRASFFKKN